MIAENAIRLEAASHSLVWFPVESNEKNILEGIGYKPLENFEKDILRNLTYEKLE